MTRHHERPAAESLASARHLPAPGQGDAVTDPDAVRRAYDALADEYDAARGDDPAGLDRVRAFLAECGPGARVLDAGCGGGRPVLARLAAGPGPDEAAGGDDEAAGGDDEATGGDDDATVAAVGLDFSREQLRLAAGNAPGAALVRGDLRALPFADGEFDAVTAYHALIHVPRDEHATTLAAFARVLRPGGVLLVTEGELAWEGTNPDWLGAGVEMRWSMAGPAATREALVAAGFEVLDAWRVPDTLGDEGADGGGDAADAGKPYFFARLRE